MENACRTPLFLWFCPSFCDLVHTHVPRCPCLIRLQVAKINRYVKSSLGKAKHTLSYSCKVMCFTSVLKKTEGGTVAQPIVAWIDPLSWEVDLVFWKCGLQFKDSVRSEGFGSGENSLNSKAHSTCKTTSYAFVFCNLETSSPSTPRLYCLIRPLFSSWMKLARTNTLCLFTRRQYYLIGLFFVGGWNWQELI